MDAKQMMPSHLCQQIDTKQWMPQQWTMPTNAAANTLPRFCGGIVWHPCVWHQIFDSLPWRKAGGRCPPDLPPGGVRPLAPRFWEESGCGEVETK